MFSYPFPIAYAGAVVLDLLTFKKKHIGERVQRMVEPRVYPHDEATKDFGYNPLEFKDGVREEIEMYKASKLIK